MNSLSLLLAAIVIAAVPTVGQSAEPTNAKEAAAKKAKAAAAIDAKYQAWVKTLSPDHQAWERVLQSELGGFYLPIHKQQKVAGKANAWDFVVDDPKLPRVLLIGDWVSRAYTETVRRELAGKAKRKAAGPGPLRSDRREATRSLLASLGSAHGPIDLDRFQDRCSRSQS
jgi:hypothetical protein